MLPRERVRKYIQAVLELLEQRRDLWSKYPQLYENARLYAYDAQHYLQRGDIFAALACIAYAEGLLDALRLLEKEKLEWSSPRTTMPRAAVLGCPKKPSRLSSLYNKYIVYIIVISKKEAAWARCLRWVDEVLLVEPAELPAVLARLKPSKIIVARKEYLRLSKKIK